MGLLRFLFYLLVGYIAYVLLRTLFRKTGNRQDDEHLTAGRAGNARLEEDPVCGVYIARETAVRKHLDGRDIFFCSENCAEKYLSGRTRE